MLALGALQIANAQPRHLAVGEQLPVRRDRAELRSRSAYGLRAFGRGILLRGRELFLEALNLRVLLGVHRPRVRELALERSDAGLRRRQPRAAQAAISSPAPCCIASICRSIIESRSCSPRSAVAFDSICWRSRRRAQVGLRLLRQLAHVRFFRLRELRLELVEPLLARRSCVPMNADVSSARASRLLEVASTNTCATVRDALRLARRRVGVGEQERVELRALVGATCFSNCDRLDLMRSGCEQSIDRGVHVAVRGELLFPHDLLEHGRLRSCCDIARMRSSLVQRRAWPTRSAETAGDETPIVAAER